MKGVNIFLANGFEETEALATVDVLRRGGVEVNTISIYNDKFVVGAHDIPVVADMTYGEFKANLCIDGTDKDDVMIFPGGMPGTKHLAGNGELINLMRLHYAEGGTVAAICAAPGLVCSQLTTLKGKKFTCFDGFEEAPIEKGGKFVKKGAVVDGNLITGRGAGFAIDFGLAILEHIQGKEVAEKTKKALML